MRPSQPRALALFSIALALLAIVIATGRGKAAPADDIVVAMATTPELERADAFFDEGSYALAAEAFLAIDTGRLEADLAAWVEFRRADAGWRALAGSESADTGGLEAERARLAEMEVSGRLMAEVQESLGDYWWTRRNARNWGQAWQHYQQALDHWAGSSEIEVARERYLAIVWRAVRPPQPEPWYRYGVHGNRLPVRILSNVLEISEDPSDRGHAHYLLAMELRSGGGAGAIKRTEKHFEAALEGGRAQDWYDDALYHYAEWLARAGRVVRVGPGQVRADADYPRALSLLRRLVDEFDPGETRYHDDAQRMIAEITAPDVRLVVSGFFLHGAEVQADLIGRNVGAIDVAVYPVQLVDDLAFRKGVGSHQWLDAIQPEVEPIRRWNESLSFQQPHAVSTKRLELADLPGRGAYLVEATAAGKTARELVLVTDTALVLRTFPDRVIAFLTQASTGAPIANGDVALWTSWRHDSDWQWTKLSARTDGDGLAVIELPGSGRRNQLFAAAASGDERQALASGNVPSLAQPFEGWRVYVETDRPAFRPEETIHWKTTARQQSHGVYRTPAGETLRYRILGPRGTEVSAGELKLGEFGSGWDELTLDGSAALGEYRIEFRDTGNRSIGTAQLFRLEEYKLPEFRVRVETGAPLRAGDTLSADVLAEYYFGGPVAGAQVEVVVRQRPFWIHWLPPRDFPWLFEASRHRPGWDGGGQIVHQESLTTDEAGRAHVEFDTPEVAQGDFEYVVEARVTDASRREILGQGKVRVSRQRHFAFLSVPHLLYRPGDEVRVRVRTVDANGSPVPVEGRFRVTRQRWVERDDERGYEEEEVLEQTVRTRDDGETEVSFRIDETGYFQVTWHSDEDELWPVQASAMVWVADRDSVQLGYRPGGVQLLLDRDSLTAGATTPVMVVAPVAGAHVLVTIEGDGLLEHRMLRLDGTVRLLEIEIDSRFVPNVFIEAVMVHDAQLLTDSRELVVPPVEQFLEVEVASDREAYLPGEEATLTVSAKDFRGQPARAEVTLAMIDESVLYIQEEYSTDPRSFFYGTKRGRRSRTLSSFQLRRYLSEEQVEASRPDEPSIEGEVRSRMDFAEHKMARAAAPAPMAVEEDAGGALADEGLGTVEVRSDFRSTALWKPDVVTGDDGTTSVSFTMPDSLTTWKATARAATVESRVGQSTSTTRTRKPLMAQLQTPRFLVAGDRVTLSTVVHNQTETELQTVVELTAEGVVLLDAARRTIRVPAGGEQRVEWAADANISGTARLAVRARGGDHSDGMERTLVVHEHGIEKLLARNGKVGDAADELSVTLELPAARREGSTELVVQVTPSLAVTMLDALPYLIDYPYGCTEQTMSRFLPTVIVARTLERLGLSRQLVASRAFGGIEARHTAATHPDGAGDMNRLDRMVREGLVRLRDLQHADGGWGWWKGGPGDRFMSGYVVWGLALARDAGLDVDEGMLQKGVRFLARNLVEEEDGPDMQAWMLHALAASDPKLIGSSERPFVETAFDRLWERRDSLNAYTRALLALSARRLGDDERARTLLRNLQNGVQRDRDRDMPTAHWGEDGIYWRWSDGGVEATAFALMAFMAIDPDHELVEPVLSWLVQNRRGAQWKSTRDTAIVVMAFTDYLAKSGELGGEVSYEVEVNGHRIAERRITRDELLSAPSRFVVDPDELNDGKNRVRVVRRSGDGPLYISAEARFFSLEEPITTAANELAVRREYHRLIGRRTLLKGYVYDKQPLSDGDALQSGDRVEVLLTIEADNHLEYLIFEDLKPAGLEAIRIRSGELLEARQLGTSRTRWVYQELRDRKIAMFVDRLAEGTWELRYELRAETPGVFHALPVIGQAMYVPEIRGHSGEVRIEVTR